MVYCPVNSEIMIVDVDNDVIYNDTPLLLPKGILNLLLLTNRDSVKDQHGTTARTIQVKTDAEQQERYTKFHLLYTNIEQHLYTDWISSFSLLLPQTTAPELSESQLAEIYRTVLDSFSLLVGSYNLFLHKEISTTSTSISIHPLFLSSSSL